MPPRLAGKYVVEKMREGAGDEGTYVRYSPWPFKALEVTEGGEHDGGVEARPVEGVRDEVGEGRRRGWGHGRREGGR